MNSIVYGYVCFWIFHTSAKWKKSSSIHFNILIMLFKPRIKGLSNFRFFSGSLNPSITKRNPNGVFFKLFRLLKCENIVEWTHLLHTRKSTWRVVFPTVVYPFFGSYWLVMKKEHSSQSWLEEFSWVLFYTFSDPRD